MKRETIYLSNHRTGEKKEISEFVRFSFINDPFCNSENYIDDICAVELSNNTYLCFPLFFWDIDYEDFDGNTFHNGKCTSTPLTDEERGIGIIDVLNGDGCYDSDGHFHSFHNYDD